MFKSSDHHSYPWYALQSKIDGSWAIWSELGEQPMAICKDKETSMYIAALHNFRVRPTTRWADFDD